jgi:hypothetical protein
MTVNIKSSRLKKVNGKWPCCIDRCVKPAKYGGQTMGTSALVCDAHKDCVAEPVLLEDEEFE